MDGHKEAFHSCLQVVYDKCLVELDSETADIERYVRKLDVINRGFGGYQTDWAIPVCEQVRRLLLRDDSVLNRSVTDLCQAGRAASRPKG